VWVCATAPKVEKKTYNSATSSADIRLCLKETAKQDLKNTAENLDRITGAMNATNTISIIA
jgi:hypothetical protein